MKKKIQIVDEFDMPLVNAHVLQGSNGSTTDNQGFAYIDSNYPGQIKISYVGMQTQTHSFNSVPQKVIMKMESLNEVVIVATKPKNEMPKYLIPAIGAGLLLLALMSFGSEPKEVTL